MSINAPNAFHMPYVSDESYKILNDGENFFLNLKAAYRIGVESNAKVRKGTFDLIDNLNRFMDLEKI